MKKWIVSAYTPYGLLETTVWKNSKPDPILYVYSLGKTEPETYEACGVRRSIW
jgi:hypothetical protein